jgi:hypothetical protein
MPTKYPIPYTGKAVCMAIFKIDYLFPFLRYRYGTSVNSVADPGCLFRIPDPKTATKERSEKKFVVITFYVATNYTKLKIILVLMC